MGFDELSRAAMPKALSAARATGKPNVVFILTDDQGYGDMGCHGNKFIHTPLQDKLHAESVRFTDFHVSPCCSPTRAQLMTGRYSSRTGVWHTVQGRSLLHRDEVTMADVFKAGGYRTGIFGKWHLGDNYPYRPKDRGFDEVLIHGGGGVGNIPDYWANNYFDDTYCHNGKWEKYEGYCTDVWFDGALKFIEASKGKPFFCYIPANAPHLPWVVPEKYAKLYRGKLQPGLLEFYGMITNIDDNLGRLRKKLAELGIADNTILIFMTDNGTSGGSRKFNSGMRGAKGSPHDGGHRVPFCLHWPAGGMDKGRDVANLTGGIDVLPTLMEMCGLKRPKGPPLDGVSLAPLTRGEAKAPSTKLGASWPDRTICVDNQRITNPVKWNRGCAMTDRWRLVDNKELYDIKKDPGQKRNVIKDHPDVAARLRADFDKWWDSLADSYKRDYPISIGSDEENPAMITTHDIIGRDIWNHDQVLAASPASGHWILNVERAGEYELSLRRYPKEADGPITAAVPTPKPLKSLNYFSHSLRYAIEHDQSRPVPAGAAGLRIGSFEKKTPIPAKVDKPSDDYVTNKKGEVLAVNFRVKLPAGKTRMEAWFERGKTPAASPRGAKRVKKAKYGGGLSLSGGCIQASGLGTFKKMTLAMWVKIRVLPRGHNVLLHSDGWSRGDLHTMFLGDGRLNFCVNGAGADSITFPKIDGRKLVGKWTHVAMVYDAPAKTATAYINGRKRGVVRHGKSLPINLDAPLRIGGWDSADRALDGTVDDIRIYSQALTAGEVAAVMKNEPVKKTPAVWWKLDEAEGDEVTDASGNKHAGKIVSGKAAAPRGGGFLTSAYFVYVTRL